MWLAGDGHESGRRVEADVRNHTEATWASAEVQWQTPHVATTCCCMSAGMPHSAHMSWEVVSSCSRFYSFPLECCLSAILHQEKVVYQSPWSILMLHPFKPTFKWFYTRIYRLILLFRSLPFGHAALLVKLLNYQWGIGSWTEADLTTRSNKSITHEFQMSTFYIFRTDQSWTIVLYVLLLVYKSVSCTQVWRISMFRLHQLVMSQCVWLFWVRSRCLNTGFRFTRLSFSSVNLWWIIDIQQGCGGASDLQTSETSRPAITIIFVAH